MESKWYLVCSEPRAEYQSAEALARDGFEIFFPRVTSPRPRLGHADTPPFPGNLFLRIYAEAECWPTLRSAHRVSGWLSTGGVVPWISDEVVSELKNRVDALNGTNGLWRRFKVGETVQVVSRTLEGLAEVIEEPKSPQARALVLLQFMGRLVLTRVPWADLHPVSDQPKQEERVPRRTRGGRRWDRGHRPTMVSNASA